MIDRKPLHAYLDADLPLVVVCNISETFFEFLSFAEQEAQRKKLIRGEQVRGDRALIWLGADKLVFMSHPVKHAGRLREQFGYDGTCWRVPEEPSPWLSRDILADPELMAAIVEHAGPERTIQLIPYATTPEFYELVDVLTAQHQLTVYHPETPDRDRMWIRDYLDTKSGFRAFAAYWLPDAPTLLPEGFVCHSVRRTAQAVYWFHRQDRACVIKADIGENGIGNLFQPGDGLSEQEIYERIAANPFLKGDCLIVEEFVQSSRSLSPSLELFVPAPEEGEPYFTYLSRQLLTGFGDFYGVVVSRELNNAPWAADLFAAGLHIARKLQEMGYVGHFDLDAVVDDDDQVHLVEINTRRTGGTHTHEFATHVFGPDYLDAITLLSNDAISSGSITDYEELVGVVDDLRYPHAGQQRGVVITGTSALPNNEFGAIVIGSSIADVQGLADQLKGRFTQGAG